MQDTLEKREVICNDKTRNFVGIFRMNSLGTFFAAAMSTRVAHSDAVRDDLCRDPDYLSYLIKPPIFVNL